MYLEYLFKKSSFFLYLLPPPPKFTPVLLICFQSVKKIKNYISVPSGKSPQILLPLYLTVPLERSYQHPQCFIPCHTSSISSASSLDDHSTRLSTSSSQGSSFLSLMGGGCIDGAKQTNKKSNYSIAEHELQVDFWIRLAYGIPIKKLFSLQSLLLSVNCVN